MQSEIRVLIVDDHELVRVGIKRNLSATSHIQVVGDVSCGEEAVRLAPDLRPDVVLLDYKMPGMNGLETATQLLKLDPNLKILMVTVLLDEFLLPKLFKAGVTGFYSKSSSHDEMLKAIHQVHRGHRYISPIFMQPLIYKHLEQDKFIFDSLSERELQVILMLLDGYSIPQIAFRLNVDPKTVSSYRTRSFHKLNVKNDVELTLLGIRQTLL